MLAVGCGAALGALLRFFVGLAVLATGFPVFWATGIVNVVGSLVIGFVATISGPDGRLLVRPAARQFVMSGFCGGLTTFSAMSLDAFILVAAGRPGGAAAYLAIVVLVSVAAAFAGQTIAERVNR